MEILLLKTKTIYLAYLSVHINVTSLFQGLHQHSSKKPLIRVIKLAVNDPLIHYSHPANSEWRYPTRLHPSSC